MKTINVKHLVLLSAPSLLLLGFGFLRPSRPTFRIRSIQFSQDVNGGLNNNMKGRLGVNVFLDYSDSSISGRFSGQDILWFDDKYGLYVEDEHGNRYRKGRLRVMAGAIDENSYGLRFSIPLDQFPKSAGRLTLRTIIIGGTENKPARLPISIVVRK